MVKKIAIALVAVVIVAAGGLYFLYSNLGAILKAAIEKYGSEATLAQVQVESITLSATSGEGSIKGLIIGNPSGFSTPRSFELGMVSMKVDIATLTQNPVVIKEIVIAAPKVTYERALSGGNLEKIQENVGKYAGGSGGSGGAGSPPASSPPSSSGSANERKVIIENLYVRDGQVAVSATALQGRTLSASLPAIHLRDIGKDKGGADPAEVARRVIGTISSEAAKVAVADLQKTLGNLGGAAQQQMQNVAPGIGDRLRGIVPGGGSR